MITAVNYLTALAIVVCGWALQTAVNGITRKTTARIQKRYGPVWYQDFRDLFKLLGKRSVTHGWVFDLGIMLSLACAVGAATFLPVAGVRAFPFDGFFMVAFSLEIAGFARAMSSAASGNPLASIGSMRNLVQSMGYKLPFLVVAIAVINGYGTGSISRIVEIQQSSGWTLFTMPLGSLAAFVALYAMMGKKPFDTYYAPAEIASGPMVEFGGRQLGVATISHQISTFVELTMFVNIFLGGAGGIAEFLAKYFVLFTFISFIDVVMGRFRVEQSVKFFMRVPAALTLAQIILIRLPAWR